MVQMQTSMHIGFLEEGVSTGSTVESLAGHCVFILFLLRKGFGVGLKKNTYKPTQVYGEIHTHTQISHVTIDFHLARAKLFTSKN